MEGFVKHVRGSTARERRIAAIESYDEDRRVASDAINVVDNIANLKRTVFSGVLPQTCPIDGITATLKSSGSDNDKAKELKKLCPILAGLDLQQPPPTPRQPPFFVDALKTMRLLTDSADLYNQFNLETGFPIGHQMESTRAATTWMQGSKFTGHPLVISLTLVQIHVSSGQRC